MFKICILKNLKNEGVKNMKKKFVIYTIFLTLLWIQLYAKYSGNYTGYILMFNPDGNSVASAGSLFSEYPLVNAAGLAALYQPKFSLTHILWAEGIRYSYLSYSSPFSFGNLGFSLSYLDYGDIEGINMDLETYSIPSSYDMLFTVSYARRIEETIPVHRELGLVGANIKFIKSQLAFHSAEAAAIDLGCVINIGKILDYGLITPLKTAIVYKNLGSTLKFVSKDYPLPENINFALKYDLVKLKKLTLLTNFSFIRDANPIYSVGFSVQPFYFLTLLGGYKHSKDSLNTGITAGFNINFGFLNFNYAFQQFSEFSTLSNLGLVHQVSIELGLGRFISLEVASDYYLRQHLDFVYELYYKKEYELAKSKLDEILALYPDSDVAKKLLEKINKSIEKQQQKKDDTVKSLLKKADIATHRKDFLTAKKNYELVLKFDPTNTEAAAGLKTVDEELAKLRQQKINQQNEKKIRSLWKAAENYYKRGEYIKAKERLSKILEIDPEHTAAKESLALIDTQLAALTAAQINELYTKGVDLYNSAKYEEAKKYFEAVLIANPDRLDAKEYLDRCENAIKEEQERKKQEELAKKQKEVETQMRSMFDKALKAYEKSDYLVALDLFEKAKGFAALYQFNEYIEQSNRYIDTIKITLSEDYYKKGYQLYQQNKFEQAYEEYKKSLKYNPNNLAAKTAMEELGKSLAQKYYELGISLYTSGNTTEAKEMLKKSLYYQPDKEEAQRALERIK